MARLPVLAGRLVDNLAVLVRLQHHGGILDAVLGDRFQKLRFVKVGPRHTGVEHHHAVQAHLPGVDDVVHNSNLDPWVFWLHRFYADRLRDV